MSYAHHLTIFLFALFSLFSAKPSDDKEKESTSLHRLPSNLGKGKDQGRTLDNVDTKFFVATEVSEVLWSPLDLRFLLFFFSL